jgi:hypothetical protein
MKFTLKRGHFNWRVTGAPLYAGDMNRDEIAQACLDQAEWAAKLGSPMYEAILRRMADDVRDSGPCLVALEPHMPR